MTKPKPPSRVRGSRRWKTPPAPHRRIHETIRGVEILNELPGRLGQFLWPLLRDLELWAASSPDRRTALFQDVLDRPPGHTLVGIESHVGVLLQMISGEHPGAGALACRKIAAWASHTAPATALYYAWAAAALAPQSGSFARGVAIQARRIPDPLLAESWLRRAIALARTDGDWATYARAFADLGELFAAREQQTSAHRAFTRTLLVCRRRSLPRALRGKALLGLLRLRLSTGAGSDVEHLMGRLLRLYGAGHQQALRTRVAVAKTLVEHGEYRLAIGLLKNTASLRGDENARAAVARLLAVATAQLEQPR